MSEGKQNDRDIERRIAEQILRRNYERVSYYDVRSGRIHLKRMDGTGEVPYIKKDYEDSVEEALALYADEEEWPKLRRKWTVANVMAKLEEAEVYSVFYKGPVRDLPDGRRLRERRKTEFFYLDESHDIIVILCSDITAAYALETASRDEAMKALEQANNAKTEFVSRVSHDIRTPISIISSMTSFAEEDIHDEGKLRDDLDRIRTANTFLLSLIDDVLDISKIDSGKITLNPTPYVYEEHTNITLNALKTLCENKGLKYYYERRRKTGVIVADRVRLNQVIFNLISNAVKYTPPGGTVSYISDSEDLPDNTIRFGFELRDTGIGMSEEFQKVMFEPFSQEYNNPDRPSGITGTGLGLFIVKRIVDLMGGTIQVESAVGKGTTIRCYIVFPDALRDPKYVGFNEKKETRPDTGECLEGKALLVEDNELNMEIAERIITKFGMKVDKAGNGKEAVEKFAASKPGEYKAILMDIQMPVMNGYEATKAIRALDRPDAGNIPIIAMTADAFKDAMERGRAAGMSEYLVKPLEPDKIFEALRKL